MNPHNLLSSGSCSVVLGIDHYHTFTKPKKNKLLKITNIIPNHNEFRNLEIVRKIPNYQKYYAIPDEVSFLLRTNDKFYKQLKRKFMFDKEVKLFTYNINLTCNYVDYAGDKDLYDSLNDIEDGYSIWTSYSVIMSFIKQISNGLKHLHNNKLCHLDIKPENIMVNSYNKTFKIIDFGFCEQEPFFNFLNDVRGTPGYFPKHYDIIKYNKYLPKIYANDFIPDEKNLMPVKKTINCYIKQIFIV